MNIGAGGERGVWVPSLYDLVEVPMGLVAPGFSEIEGIGLGLGLASHESRRRRGDIPFQHNISTCESAMSGSKREEWKSNFGLPIIRDV